MPPLVQAVLQLPLSVDRGESPVAEQGEHDDRDQRGDIRPAPACVLAVMVRRTFAHAMRLDGLSDGLPSAVSAVATIPFASSPAAAYMRSGLSCS